MKSMFEITNHSYQYYAKERLLGCQHGDGLIPVTKTSVRFEAINLFRTRTGHETITVHFDNGKSITYNNGIVTTDGSWPWIQDVLVICYGAAVSELTEYSAPDYPSPVISVDGERFETHWAVENGIEFPKL